MASQESTPEDRHRSPDTGRSNDTPDPSEDEPSPSLGYNGTSGYNSQSDTSREAAYHDLVEGVTAKAQRLVLILAAQAGTKGITIAEVREAKGSLHHGKMSSALTNLHKDGRLARLEDRRGRCHIYVLPEFVDERVTQVFRPNRPQIDRVELVNLLDHHRMISDLGGRRCYCLGWEGSGTVGYREHLADVIVAEFGR
jgi:hypothetical protein